MIFINLTTGKQTTIFSKIKTTLLIKDLVDVFVKIKALSAENQANPNLLIEGLVFGVQGYSLGNEVVWKV